MRPDPDPSHPAPGMHVWGWMAPAELWWLSETAASMGSVVEVGCLHGRSAYALLKGCRGPVYCVDPWNDEADASYPSFMSNCGRFPNLRTRRCASTVAARTWARDLGLVDRLDMVDMTFIDASHAYESVMVDVASWLPLTSKLICGHDYTPEGGYEGVRRAVDEIFGDRVRVAAHAEGPTSIWCVDLESDRSVAEGLPTELDYVDEYGVHYREALSW